MSAVNTLLKVDPGLPLMLVLQLGALVSWIWVGFRPTSRLRHLGVLLLAGATLLALFLLLVGGLEAGSLLARSAAMPLVGLVFGLLLLVTLIQFRGGPARLGVSTSLVCLLLAALALPRAAVEVPPAALLPQFLRVAGFSQILLAGLLASEGLLTKIPTFDFDAGVLKALRAGLLLLGGAVVTVLWELTALGDAFQGGDLRFSLLLLAGLGALLHLHHVKAWRGRGLSWGSLGLGLIGLLAQALLR